MSRRKTEGAISKKSGSIDASSRKTVLAQSTASLGTEKSESSTGTQFGKSKSEPSKKRETIKKKSFSASQSDRSPSPEGKSSDKESRKSKDLRRKSSRKDLVSRGKTKDDLEGVSSEAGDLIEFPKPKIIASGELADETLLRVAASSFAASSKDAGPSTDIAAVYEMLRAGEDAEQRTTSGLTPLSAAAATGNKHLVAILLERGADVGVVDSLGHNELAMHAAARRGHAAVCVLLADKTRELGKLDMPCHGGWTPLHFAVRGGHLGVVKALLRAKADAAGQNHHHGGDTAIHLSARAQDTEVLEELLDWCPAGAWNIQNAHGETALHTSARSSSRSCVSTLLRFRSDPHIRSRNGQTALDIAEEIAKTNPSFAAVVSLITAYMRPKPLPLRSDARFDI